MPRWVKFVALFLLVFALFDVSTPEACADDLFEASRGAIQIHGNNTNPPGGDSCQFEEDCIACAHILPSTHFEFQVVTVVAPYVADLNFLPLDGTSFVPYLPPRV
jgi:hypothetical protein